MARLTKYEKETIILYNQTGDPASIYTHDASLKRRLEKFVRLYSECCQLESASGLGLSPTSLTGRSWSSGSCSPIPPSEGRKPASMRNRMVMGAAKRIPLEIGHFSVRMSAVEPMFLPLHNFRVARKDIVQAAI